MLAGEMVALKVSGATTRTRYFHKDFLGSIVALTDETGAVVERHSFDAGGQRRTEAEDLAAHRGYDTFHRNLDAEVAGSVRPNPNATQGQFERYLRGVYERPDVLERFPNGL